MTFELFVSTLVAAFAGSLAAVLVSVWIELTRRRAAAKADILMAIGRHCERLARYSSDYSREKAAARRFSTTGDVPGAPTKPPMKLLEIEVRGIGAHFSGDARHAVEEIANRASNAEVKLPPSPDEIADWESEVDGLQELALNVAQWSGKGARLPTATDLGQAPVMR